MDAFGALMLASGGGSGASGSLVSISPPVLFFFLGVLVVLVRSHITIPEAATKLLSLYLLWAIGFRGGVELVGSGLNAEAMKTAAAALGLSVLIPVVGYSMLRRVVARKDAAAISACYGSVSVVTFLTACATLDQAGTPFSGYMVAVMALMESPAIVISLILLNLDKKHGTERSEGPGIGTLLHESLLNGPVLLLLGSIVVGVLTGQRGYEAFKPLCTDAFPGALAFFLLDLGMIAARRLGDVARAPRLVLAYAVVGPLVHAALAIAAAKWLGIGPGDAILLAVLAASASYIAAPAALRLAIPKADPGLYVALSLGVTFSFNIVAGIPLYAAVVKWLW